MSLTELWKIGSRNDAITVDSRGRVVIDRKKFISNRSVQETVDALRTRLGNDSARTERPERPTL